MIRLAAVLLLVLVLVASGCAAGEEPVRPSTAVLERRVSGLIEEALVAAGTDAEPVDIARRQGACGNPSTGYEGGFNVRQSRRYTVPGGQSEVILDRLAAYWRAEGWEVSERREVAAPAVYARRDGYEVSAIFGAGAEDIALAIRGLTPCGSRDADFDENGPPPSPSTLPPPSEPPP